MDAEPARVLQPSDEEVRMLQRLERGRRVGASEDVVAERDGEVTEDRRTQQEPARRLIERAEDLVVQVVGDESMISAELAHRFVRILDAAKPEQREVEGSRPALRSLAVAPRPRRAREQARLVRRAGRVPPPAVRARSLARTSASAPLARSRARLSDGSDRVSTISRVARGQVVECEVDRFEALEIGDAWKSSSTSVSGGAERRDAVHQLDHRALDECPGVFSRRSAPRPRPPRTCSTAMAA